MSWPGSIVFHRLARAPISTTSYSHVSADFQREAAADKLKATR
jgi:hypothetical protein